MGTDFSPPLEPIHWFKNGHKPGVHVWAPPPAAALVALKQLARSRHKRPHTVQHVFICQRLLWQELWRKRFEKEMDLWFILHPGTHWPPFLFEPLVIGISFPMLNREQGPWLVRQEREQVLEAGRTLSEMSKSSHVHDVRELGALSVIPHIPLTDSALQYHKILMVPRWLKLKMKCASVGLDLVIICAVRFSVLIVRVRTFAVLT